VQASPEPAAPTVAAPEPKPAPVAAPPPLQEESAPRYPGDGFQAPRLANRTCIADGLRLPPQVDASSPALVTVRVAVAATGQVTQVQVMGQVADPRISDAVRRAVQDCEWLPGADAAGKPTALWVVQPIRLSR
jgi:hypothetical protein